MPESIPVKNPQGNGHDEPQFLSEFDRQLFAVESSVAKRADELARIIPRSTPHQFECWRQAEVEIWDKLMAEFTGMPQSGLA